jgi:hypothetical protein
MDELASLPLNALSIALSMAAIRSGAKKRNCVAFGFDFQVEYRANFCTRRPLSGSFTTNGATQTFAEECLKSPVFSVLPSNPLSKFLFCRRPNAVSFWA